MSSKQPNDVVSMFGYSNDVNPYGDNHLTDKFVWKKKEQSEKKHKKHKSESKKRSRNDEQDKIKEIRKVKERRIQREVDQKQWQETQERIARERERATYTEFEKKEEAFHLKQTKLRSEIRFREGRAKPIDYISKNLKLLEKMEGRTQESDYIHPLDRRYDDKQDDFDIEIREPYTVMEGLSVNDLQDLKQEIGQHLELDLENESFWRAVCTVCDDELERATLREREKNSKILIQEEGIHSSVRDEIDSVFAGKSRAELEDMEIDIKKTIETPDDSDQIVDVEYWESLLRHLQVFKAKALLREMHAKVLEKRLEELQKMQVKEEPPQPAPTPTVSEKEDRMFEFEEGDEDFNDTVIEAPEDTRTYKANDKYRPRKPKYFNRVHTGYEWNKYNRTHYDADNPPPKVIQGYKFNIFYPDLLDKTQTPTYFIEPGDTKDTCIIRFQAGPPYEPIAFKIVNREWEKTSRRGYKCTFERGILHLYFKFKKFKYRR
jgi:hypothetical protein